MKLILSLDSIGTDDRERVGGKGFALATMADNGMQVPETVCIAVDAYHRYLNETGLDTRILMEFNRKDFKDVRWEERWDGALRIRNLFNR